jgi:flagellar export protein FliJ
MFRFSLQTVLEHREALEEKCQREHGQQLARLRTIQEKGERIVAEIESCGQRVRQGQLGGMSFAQRDILENWIGRQQGEVGRLNQAASEQAERVERDRLKLVESAKARTIMEKLRQNEEKDWHREVSRAEQRRFDEIGLRKYIDRQRREKAAH